VGKGSSRTLHQGTSPRYFTKGLTLAADPARVRDLPPELAQDLFPKVAALQVRGVSLDGAG